MKNLDFIVQLSEDQKLQLYKQEKKNTYMKSEGQQIQAD